MRLEKYISSSGVASRRAVKQAVRDGRVNVNGIKILIPGHPIDPNKDTIELDSERVKPITEHIYLMLHKPSGYITTRHDERGRPTVMDLLTDLPNSIYPVGRLDLDTEGLLLFTNDGDFANRMLHPRHGIKKTYLVWINGVLTDGALMKFSQGIPLPSGTTAPAQIKPEKIKSALNANGNKKKQSDVELGKYKVKIHEGKKRQVRLMFKALGHRVVRLKRTRIGSLGLGQLPLGQYRLLTETEVAGLKG